MQAIYTSTVPLAAGAILKPPLINVSGFGDVPVMFALVSSDQPGTLAVYETEQGELLNQICGGPVVGSNVPMMISAPVNRQNLQIVYTNGTVAQANFSLTIFIPSLSMSGSQRVNELILRELRAISMLIYNLKEPTGVGLNFPFGPTNFTS